MNEPPRRLGSQRVRWILYVFLFDLAALLMMGFFGILYFFTSFIGWLIVPSGLVYGVAILVSLVLFTALYLLARRKRWVWLKALALGGASVPVLLAVLVLLGSLLFLGRDADDAARPNQQRRLSRFRRQVRRHSQRLLDVGRCGHRLALRQR
jgi:hypothetical protein